MFLGTLVLQEAHSLGRKRDPWKRSLERAGLDGVRYGILTLASSRGSEAPTGFVHTKCSSQTTGPQDPFFPEQLHGLAGLS